MKELVVDSRQLIPLGEYPAAICPTQPALPSLPQAGVVVGLYGGRGLLYCTGTSAQYGLKCVTAVKGRLGLDLVHSDGLAGSMSSLLTVLPIIAPNECCKK